VLFSRLLDNRLLATPAEVKRPLVPDKESDQQEDKELTFGETVIRNVVTTANLIEEDEQFVVGELEWLFSAIDTYIKIHRGEIAASRPVEVSIPPKAERTPLANNKMLDIDDFYKDLWAGQIEGGVNRIEIHQRNLDILLKREDALGEAGKSDISLQNQIRGIRIGIAEILQEVATVMKRAYGIFVTSPKYLLKLLDN
ncbi:MAG: hypothetical protein GY797_37305, partial [Deltaproteobacteria bacterium]|nr:hypothetical protein [Deltaproteobacteria bacterium]